MTQILGFLLCLLLDENLARTLEELAEALNVVNKSI